MMDEISYSTEGRMAITPVFVKPVDLTDVERGLLVILIDHEIRAEEQSPFPEAAKTIVALETIKHKLENV